MDLSAHERVSHTDNTGRSDIQQAGSSTERGAPVSVSSSLASGGIEHDTVVGNGSNDSISDGVSVSSDRDAHHARASSSRSLTSVSSGHVGTSQSGRSTERVTHAGTISDNQASTAHQPPVPELLQQRDRVTSSSTPVSHLVQAKTPIPVLASHTDTPNPESVFELQQQSDPVTSSSTPVSHPVQAKTPISALASHTDTPDSASRVSSPAAAVELESRASDHFPAAPPPPEVAASSHSHSLVAAVGVSSPPHTLVAAADASSSSSLDGAPPPPATSVKTAAVGDAEPIPTNEKVPDFVRSSANGHENSCDSKARASQRVSEVSFGTPSTSGCLSSAKSACSSTLNLSGRSAGEDSSPVSDFSSSTGSTIYFSSDSSLVDSSGQNGDSFEKADSSAEVPLEQDHFPSEPTKKASSHSASPHAAILDTNGQPIAPSVARESASTAAAVAAPSTLQAVSPLTREVAAADGMVAPTAPASDLDVAVPRAVAPTPLPPGSVPSPPPPGTDRGDAVSEVVATAADEEEAAPAADDHAPLSEEVVPSTGADNGVHDDAHDVPSVGLDRDGADDGVQRVADACGGPLEVISGLCAPMASPHTSTDTAGDMPHVSLSPPEAQPSAAASASCASLPDVTAYKTKCTNSADNSPRATSIFAAPHPNPASIGKSPTLISAPTGTSVEEETVLAKSPVANGEEATHPNEDSAVGERSHAFSTSSSSAQECETPSSTNGNSSQGESSSASCTSFSSSPQPVGSTLAGVDPTLSPLNSKSHATRVSDSPPRANVNATTAAVVDPTPSLSMHSSAVDIARSSLPRVSANATDAVQELGDVPRLRDYIDEGTSSSSTLPTNGAAKGASYVCIRSFSLVQ